MRGLLATLALTAVALIGCTTGDRGGVTQEPGDTLDRCSSLAAEMHDTIDDGANNLSDSTDDAVAVASAQLAAEHWNNAAVLLDEAVAEGCAWAETRLEGQWQYPVAAGDDFANLVVVLYETEQSAFTDGVPGPVSYIDSVAGDCAALTSERQLWAEQWTDSDQEPDLRLRALVFSLYAIDAQLDAGCPTT